MQDNKKIAKNTFFLYVRKIFTLGVSLYISRVTLEMLGVTEFGIYGLVGSIVAMFSALRGLFATSVQRFININKGENGGADVGRIFSIGVKIHLWIALAFFVIVEVAGFFLIPHLNIPAENYTVAQWVLLFSVLSAVASILTAPYDALIIANEDFKAYSVISIIEYVLRLGIVFLLVLSPISRVVFYSILVFAVSVIIRVINTWFCTRSYGEEARYRNVKDKTLLRDMTQFAGWQFFGNLGYTLTNNGVNFIINIFGGVIVNAARTIAYQVLTAIQQFVSDINVSFQPQSMRLYAEKEKEAFFNLLVLNSKTTIAITLILIFPIMMLTYPILHLWLGDVPEYTVGFVQTIMLYMAVRSIHGPIDMLFKCDGRLKKYQLAEFIIMIFNLPLSWIALKMGLPYYSAFIIMGIVEIVDKIVVLFIAKEQLGFDMRRYYRSVVWPAVATCIILGILLAGNRMLQIVPDSIGFFTFILMATVACGIAGIVELLVLFNKDDRRKLRNFLIKRVRKRQ